MEQRPFGQLDINWWLVGGSILAGLVLGAGILGLGLLLPLGEGSEGGQALIAGLLCAPLLVGASGGALAYTRANKLKLLHAGLVISISFGIIFVFLCVLVILGGQLIGTTR